VVLATHILFVAAMVLIRFFLRLLLLAAEVVAHGHRALELEQTVGQAAAEVGKHLIMLVVQEIHLALFHLKEIMAAHHLEQLIT